MGILQYDSKGMTQVVFFDLINVNAVVACLLYTSDAADD